MLKRMGLASLCALCLVLAAGSVGGRVFGQELLPHLTTPAAPSAGATAQVVVRSFVYVVPNSKRRALARRYPELVSWLGQRGFRAGGLDNVAGLKVARVERRLRAAEWAGLVELRSRARGVVRDGATLEMAAGAQYSVAVPSLGARLPRGFSVASPSAGQWLRVTPTVSGARGEGERVIELAVEFSLDTVDTYSIPSAPVINRNSISTAFAVRSGGVAIVGGIGAVRGGRVYFAVGGEVVDEDAGLPGKGR